jgi:zinc transporter, ZIP family
MPSMLVAFAWGLLAASSLLLGAAIALRFNVGLRAIGLIMAFGAGVLISALAFDLIEEAVHKATGHGAVLVGVFAGCGVFFGGDWMIDRAGGERRKSASGGQADDSALAIVLGTILDGIPESVVIGLTIYQSGAIGAAYLAAVFISNVPEALSSTSGLVARGWKRSSILGMWTLIALVSGLSSLVGYAAFKQASPDVVAFVLAFAAGAILTMLADTMMPEAYSHAGKLVGVMTTLGFATAFLIDQLD